MVIELAHLADLKRSARGQAWLSQLPDAMERVCADWQVDLCKDPYLDSTVSYVCPAMQNGVQVVLKFQWPHEECLFEADALQQWNGIGAVRLLAHNPIEHAMLLEHCSPGQTLADCALTDKLAVVIDLLPKLWIPATAPFKTLEQEARDWQSGLRANWEAANSPMTHLAMQTVYRYIDELLSKPVNQVLVHQDLHAGNVISAQRESWLAIDPKPLVGEREISIASVVRCAELGHTRSLVVERLHRLCVELNLNLERARKWTVVQTFCWALCDGARPSMFDVVGWLIEEEFK